MDNQDEGGASEHDLEDMSYKQHAFDHKDSFTADDTEERINEKETALRMYFACMDGHPRTRDPQRRITAFHDVNCWYGKACSKRYQPKMSVMTELRFKGETRCLVVAWPRSARVT